MNFVLLFIIMTQNVKYFAINSNIHLLLTLTPFILPTGAFLRWEIRSINLHFRRTFFFSNTLFGIRNILAISFLLRHLSLTIGEQFLIEICVTFKTVSYCNWIGLKKPKKVPSFRNLSKIVQNIISFQKKTTLRNSIIF